MKPYLRTSAAVAEESGLKALRSEFATQPEGKNPPQILLDYVGAGLNAIKNENENFKVDFFDYPVMVSPSNKIPAGTVLRDVGGNGGYLSIIKRDSEQNALNLDFMKFVMSPYGQSIYYDALYKAGSVPMGMTTVDNDLVTIPEAWKTFFKTDKIKFNGLVDSNLYISYLIRGFADGDETKKTIITNWQKYLTGTGSDEMNTADFIVEWTNAINADWGEYVATGKATAGMENNRDGGVAI